MSKRQWRANLRAVATGVVSGHNPEDTQHKSFGDHLKTAIVQHTVVTDTLRSAVAVYAANPENQEAATKVSRLTAQLFAARATAETWLQAYALMCPICAKTVIDQHYVSSLPPVDQLIDGLLVDASASRATGGDAQ